MSESMDEKQSRLVANWKQQRAKVRAAKAELESAERDYRSAVETGSPRKMSHAARCRVAAGAALHAAQVQAAVARSLAGNPSDDLPVEDREEALLRQRRLAEEAVLQAERDLEAAERKMSKALRQGDVPRSMVAGRHRLAMGQALHRANVELCLVRRAMGDG
jgi:hypothetical protein